MKNTIFGFFRKSALTAVIAGAMLALNPTGAMAQRGGHGGGGGFRGGGGGYRGGGAYRGGGNYYRGGGRYEGVRPRGFVGRYYPRYYVAPYFGFGYYAPVYPYTSCGYYDAWGYWHVYPGCYVNPYY